jgi:hypothetical protein
MTEGFLLADPPVTTLDDYLAEGGGAGLARARELGPFQIIEEVNLLVCAGVAGRGSAPVSSGYPCSAAGVGTITWSATPPKANPPPSRCGFWPISYTGSGRFRTPVPVVFVHPGGVT